MDGHITRAGRLGTLAMVTLMAAALAPTATSARQGGPQVVGEFRGTTTADRFDVSPPLSSMVPIPPPAAGDRVREIPERATGLEGAFGPQDQDPLIQSTAGVAQEIAAAETSFDGPGNISGVSPPDPVGDVGPNHYVAMSNLSFQIFDKGGTSLYGPAANNTLWAGFGGDCETDNAGDPIVLHDQFADRWILTQFTASGPTFFNCVAVSTSPDPTGTYYRYAFSTGAQLPRLPEVRRLARFAVHRHARVPGHGRPVRRRGCLCHQPRAADRREPGADGHQLRRHTGRGGWRVQHR